MKKTLIIISAAIITCAFVAATEWKADEKNSTVKFDLPGHAGTFSNLAASINFDKKSLADSKISATIDVKTLKTGNEKLDGHLLSPDFFDAEKFPKITFTSSEIKTTDSGFLAKGTLNMKDSTKVIELPFNFTEDGKKKATFTGTMTVMASEYGVIKKVKKPGDDKVLIYLVVPVTK